MSEYIPDTFVPDPQEEQRLTPQRARMTFSMFMVFFCLFIAGVGFGILLIGGV